MNKASKGALAALAAGVLLLGGAGSLAFWTDTAEVAGGAINSGELSLTDTTPGTCADADWVLDEQPMPIRTRTGSLVSIPYTVEINDVVISAVQQQPSDEILRRGRDQFDRLYQDGARAPRVMAISIHPYLTGVPHRIRYLEALYDHILGHDGVVMWTGAEILDWYRAEVARGS